MPEIPVNPFFITLFNIDSLMLNKTNSLNDLV